MPVIFEQMSPDEYATRITDMPGPPPFLESTWNFPKSEIVDFVSTGDAAHDRFESTKDGDAVIKTFNNFKINAGHIVTVSNRCKGLYLNILGNLVIDGTLSMTARGANAEGRYVIIDKIRKQIYYCTEQDQDFDYSKFQVIPKIGAEGVGFTTTGVSITLTPPPVTNGACGVGGNGYNAKGGNSTSFSGGAGATASINGTVNPNGGANGGAGANGHKGDMKAPPVWGGGGAGNPGGLCSIAERCGVSGTGGLMILFVEGDIIFGVDGAIQSHGSNGGDGDPGVYAQYSVAVPGSGSGGGAIHLFYRKSMNAPSKVTATGGAAGLFHPSPWAPNLTQLAVSNGGTGTVNIVKL